MTPHCCARHALHPVTVLPICSTTHSAVYESLFVQVVGEGRCPIIDSWWQTETGAAMLVPLPGAWEPTPTSATLPFFGVAPVLLDEKVSCI